MATSPPRAATDDDDLDENHPLLPPSAHLATPSRSKLQARRYLPEPQSDKARGKQRAVDGGVSASNVGDGNSAADTDGEGAEHRPGSGSPVGGKRALAKGKGKGREHTGRSVSVIFSDEHANLEVWVEDGESVGHVKERVRHLRPDTAGLQLRLIHAGRLLTDGILLLPWLRSLEERVRRQAAGVGGDVGQVLREVGLAEEDKTAAAAADSEKVYLHCNVGGPLAAADTGGDSTGASTADGGTRGGGGGGGDTPEAPAPRRRGFDTLLDAGLSAEDVANMRRQFYESRGEEVPDLGTAGENDEHARALEEQWIEGDLTPATATTSSEGMYTSILHGLLIGFLIPLAPWFFFRDGPLPNFFDAEAEAEEVAQRADEAARVEEERVAAAHAAAMMVNAPAGDGAAGGGGSGSEGGAGDGASAVAAAAASDDPLAPQPPRTSTPSSAVLETLAPPPPTNGAGTVSSRVSSSPLVGSEALPSVVFGTRMQVGVVLGTAINIVFGALRFLNS